MNMNQSYWSTFCELGKLNKLRSPSFPFFGYLMFCRIAFLVEILLRYYRLIGEMEMMNGKLKT